MCVTVVEGDSCGSVKRSMDSPSKKEAPGPPVAVQKGYEFALWIVPKVRPTNAPLAAASQPVAVPGVRDMKVIDS